MWNRIIFEPFKRIGRYLYKKQRLIFFLLAGFIASLLITLVSGKIYQRWDDDPDRGAIAITDGQFGESYSTPVYLDQGWSESDSLWFYNITQGSGLLPYDLFMNLEGPGTRELVRSSKTMDQYRYLPQKPTFFNPDGLAVGFVKDTYQGKDYIGYTCAACHTGQINYQGKAMRIDGGPAMADMASYLHYVEKGLKETLSDSAKNQRFVKSVLARNNDYRTAEQINADLQKWTKTIRLYNTVNHSHIQYGFARLDAFGRIYNRVLQYVPNKAQAKKLLTSLTYLTQPGKPGRYIISEAEADKVLEGVDETIIGSTQFATIVERLQSTEPGYPALTQREMLKVRDAFFNEPNAPVSYPFLWDMTGPKAVCKITGFVFSV